MRPRRRPWMVRCLFVGVAGLSACGQPPVVMGGNSKSVRIGFGSGDTAAIRRPALDHCAQYGKTARFSGTDNDIVYYDCVPP
jgi:hypothetical protein